MHQSTGRLTESPARPSNDIPPEHRGITASLTGPKAGAVAP